mmetsp:Transcript_22369/g.33047  ORF Transcript_22369/g.33047 Transcript_22369/m.33047 type:complete len:317 (+) Transcript_22369:232-1182(+)
MKDLSCNRLALLAFCASLGNSFHYKDGTGPAKGVRITNNEEFSKKDEAFSFSCSSFSLDESVPKTNTAGKCWPYSFPILSMSRPLTGNSHGYTQVASQKIAGNIFQTFQKSIKWRKRSWIESLSQLLRAAEQKMKQCGASDVELKSLLKTPPAILISCLKHVNIKVLAARTFFRVLPTLWGENDQERNKVDHNKDPTYVLSFKTVLNISSPSGYSEVTLEAPGTIRGTFSCLKSSERELSGVTIVVDTRVLATIIDKSNRILVRAAVESLLPLMKSDSSGMDLIPDVYQTPKVPEITPISKSPNYDNTCSSPKIPT